MPKPTDRTELGNSQYVRRSLFYEIFILPRSRFHGNSSRAVVSLTRRPTRVEINRRYGSRGLEFPSNVAWPSLMDFDEEAAELLALALMVASV